MDLFTPTVAVTGHRAFRSPADMAWVREELDRVALKLVRTAGMERGVSGFALGADLAWARSVLTAGAELHAYIPYEEQAHGWAAQDRAEWARLRAAATTEVVVGVTDGSYRSIVRLLHARNDAMLKVADLVIAVIYADAPERKGGSWSTVQKERRWHGRDRPMLLVDPAARRTTIKAPGVPF